MSTGIVKWFNNAKGYGFIKPDGGGDDVFVHISSLDKSGVDGLTENQPVTYDEETDAKGTKAVNISLT